MLPDGFLVLERIGCKVQAASKRRVLQEIGKLLSLSNPPLDEDAVYEKLQERERLGSTGLGSGIALPHARLDGVREARGAFLSLAEPVAFEAADNRPVDLVFGLLVPQSATEQHLQLLAALARLFHEKEFCDALRQAAEPEQVLAEILARRQGESPQS